MDLDYEDEFSRYHAAVDPPPSPSLSAAKIAYKMTAGDALSAMMSAMPSNTPNLNEWQFLLLL